MKNLYTQMKLKNNNSMWGNVLYSAAAKAISLVFFMATDIILARYLNIEGYAEWAFFYSIITITYYICWFGVNVSCKVHIANATEETLTAYFRAGILLRFIVSFLICLIMRIMIVPFSTLFQCSGQYVHLIDMFKLGIILVFINSFMEFFKECYNGMKDYKNLFMVTITEYFMYFFFSFIFLLYQQIPTLVVLGYVCAGCCVSFLNLLLCRKRLFIKIPNSKIIPKIREIFVYSLPLLIVSIGGMILVELDTFMLGILGTKQDVSNYNIIKQISGKLMHINNALWVGTLSSIAYITKENVTSKMLSFNKIKYVNYVIIIAVCIGTGVLMPILIPILYGEQYLQAANLVYWLLPYYALYCISTFYSTFLDFQKKAKQRSVWYISVIIIDVVLNCLLIPGFGMKGAAFATVVSLVPYTIYSIVATKTLFKRLRENN